MASTTSESEQSSTSTDTHDNVPMDESVTGVNPDAQTPTEPSLLHQQRQPQQGALMDSKDIWVHEGLYILAENTRVAALIDTNSKPHLWFVSCVLLLRWWRIGEGARV
jgi:hypothetical protein